MPEDILKKVEFNEEEEKWDVKRVFIGITILGVIIYGGISLLMPYLPSTTSYETRYSKVQGVSVDETQKINYSPDAISESVQKNVEAIKDQVNILNAAEIATSSPQVQKILKDLQGLEQYPKNQVKAVCMRMCNSL